MVGIFSLSLKKKILISMRKKPFNIRPKKNFFYRYYFPDFMYNKNGPIKKVESKSIYNMYYMKRLINCLFYVAVTLS